MITIIRKFFKLFSPKFPYVCEKCGKPHRDELTDYERDSRQGWSVNWCGSCRQELLYRAIAEGFSNLGARLKKCRERRGN